MRSRIRKCGDCFCFDSTGTDKNPRTKQLDAACYAFFMFGHGEIVQIIKQA